MTLDDMKILLAGRLGQRSDIDNMIYSEIRAAQRVLEKTPPYPWFLERGLQLEWDHEAALPDDFIEMFDDIIYLIKATADTEYLNPSVRVYGSHLEYVEIYPGVKGLPKNFIIFENGIFFYPVLDRSYTFVFRYYRRDAVLTGPASENLWSTKGEDLLIAEAGWHVARNIRDNAAATMFGQDRAEARRRMAQETTSRLESRRRAVIAAGEDAMLSIHTEAGRQ